MPEKNPTRSEQQMRCEHEYVAAINYRMGNVECRKCGALWLSYTPARDAAPDLIAALTTLANLIDHSGGKVWGYQVRDIAQAALAKAIA